MYELDIYIEAREEFPRELLDLETTKGIARPFKTDYLKKEIWYNFVEGMPGNSFKLSLTEVKDIIQKNKRGVKPEIKLSADSVSKEATLEVSLDERLDRFDRKKKAHGKSRRKRNNNKRSREGKNRQQINN